MPNSEGKKRPFGQVKTTQKRRRKSEYTKMNAAGVEPMKGSDSTQEEKYRKLVQNIPCAVYSAYPGKAGPTTFMSNKWKDLTGYSPDELYQNPEAWVGCIHRDDREHTVNTYSQACRDRMAYNLEYRVVHKDTGQLRYVRDQGHLSKDEKGAVVSVDGIVTDITELKELENELKTYRDHLEELVKERTAELTKAHELLKLEDQERKKAEEALREQRDRAQQYLDAAAVMFVALDGKGNVTLVNKRGCELLGRDETEIVDKNWFNNFLPESIREEVKAVFLELIAGNIEPVEYYENAILFNDGSQKVIAWHNTVLKDRSGNIIGVLSSGQDITERKKAEQALRESEERLKILFESAPDAIYLIDPEGRFMDGNRAVMELIGFAKDEVIRKSLAEIGLLSDGQLSKAKANLKKVATGEHSGSNEYTLKRKDGSYVSVEVRIFPVRIGGKLLTLGIARNITEHKRTEKELLEHQAKLKSLASQLSLTEERERHRLATDLHDQISQSLVISKIKLDQLRKSSTSDEFNEPLEDVCNCLGRIIDDTRTLTFDLSYPILYELGFEAAVAEWLTDQIQEKHEIKTEFVDDEHQKPLDDDIRVLLFRNVRELLINVVKHSQANKVIVSIRKVKDNICVSVEDDGVGFDPVEVTSMATKRAEFGLFSIRERLEQLGGMIVIDSEPGHGSKITMTAPLKNEDEADEV